MDGPDDSREPSQSLSEAPEASGWRESGARLALAASTRLAEVMGLEGGAAFGAWCGRSWIAVGGPRTRRVLRQLDECFPEDRGERNLHRARAVFEHLGRSAAELLLLRGRQREALLSRVTVEGLEALERARAASPSGGVLLVSAHYGSWELGGVALARTGLALSAVHRPRKLAAFEQALPGLRSGPAAEGSDYRSLPMGQAGLPLLRALGEGRAVLVLLDQNARADEAVFAPFFGRPTSVRRGPLAIALRRRIPLVPVYIERRAAGAEHVVQIEPALPWPDAALPEPARLEVLACEVQQSIEARIRRDPTQWIWTHGRWRTPPPR